MINCPYCGKLTDPQLDNCPHCGGFMRRGAAPAPTPSSSRQTCPNCHALVQDGDIICVNCGTNLLTGQKITEEKKVMARKKKGMPLWMWVAIVVAAVLLVILAVFLMIPQRGAVARANELIQDNQISKATALLSEYVKTNADDGEAQFLLGKLYWTANQYMPAAQAFRQAAKSGTGSRDAYLLAAIALASSSDAGARKEAVQVFRDMATAYPDDQEAVFLLGMALGATGDYPGQVESLQKAVSLTPAIPQASEYLGLALAALGQYPEAREQFDAALTANPGNSNLEAAMAFVTGVLGEDQASEELLRDAVGKRTDIQAIALTQLGLTLVSQGKFQEALSFLDQAKALGSSTDEAALFYGVAQAAVGNTDGALSTFNDLSNKKNSPVMAQASVLAAQALLSKGDLPRAEEAINRALSTGQGSAFMYTTKGRIEVASGQDAQARESFKSAIQADATYAAAYLEYGLFHITREQAFGEGVRNLEKYLELLEPSERQSYGKPIEDLVKQLKQSAGQETAPSAQPETASGVVS